MIIGINALTHTAQTAPTFLLSLSLTAQTAPTFFTLSVSHTNTQLKQLKRERHK